ncbi:MAG: ABC transporter permease [Desulfurococcaceae archaeon]
MGFGRYIIKSLLASIPVLIGATFIVFALIYVTGDPVSVILGEFATPELVEKLRQDLGLDKPLIVQYFIWLSRVIRGDFGVSYMSRLPVTLVVLERIPTTLMLTGTAFLISLGLGISSGVLAALRHGSRVDTIISSVIIFFFSVPYFWFATVLLWIFTVQIRLYSTIGDLFQRLWLPSIALGVPTAAAYAKLTRSNVIDTLYQDYVRTAKSKGLRERIIIIRHVLKNALLPIVALAVLRIPWLFGGAVVTESVFGWPGLGSLLITAIYRRDFPIVQAITFIIVVMITVSDILGDLLMALIDPRVRMG